MKVFINIACLSAVFFLPLLPAYLLYKFLPSKTSVRGPFKGLNINLTGAFSGYFLLVLVALSFIYFALAPFKPTYEVWQVQGTIEAKVTELSTGKKINNVAGTTIGVSPPRFTIGSSGEFSMTIMVLPGHVEGQRMYPTLTFNRPGHNNCVLDLNSEEIDINEEMKKIRLKQHVILEKLPEKTEEPKWSR